MTAQSTNDTPVTRYALTRDEVAYLRYLIDRDLSSASPAVPAAQTFGVNAGALSTDFAEILDRVELSPSRDSVVAHTTLSALSNEGPCDGRHGRFCPECAAVIRGGITI